MRLFVPKYTCAFTKLVIIYNRYVLPPLTGRVKYIFLLAFMASKLMAQEESANKLWHGIQRQMHYQPSGDNFLCVHPYKKFNRAIYGTHTAFRIEAGDLPEFALYMPGIGGNCKLGIIINNKSKWISDFDSIKTTYVPGSMEYQLKDKLLGTGQINLTILALSDAEGMIVKIASTNLKDSIQLLVLFGGASGKKLSRDGDIGADPESSFYLEVDHCKGNQYKLNQHSFQLYYGFSKNFSEEQRYEIQLKKQEEAEKTSLKELVGVFPETATLYIANSTAQLSPLTILQSKSDSIQLPVVAALFKSNNAEAQFFTIYHPEPKQAIQLLPEAYRLAVASKNKLVQRIQLNTPDAYINPLAGALAIAADAIWEEPSYLHGAVAWRMRLPAWRGAYCADPLGWHDRAQQHFDSYAKSQVLAEQTLGVVPDTALHWARQLEKIGTQMFSSGYIARNPGGDIRPHHYDMNNVFMDQLLNHFNWMGDTAYVRQMFPLLKRHLAWEKINFDADGDGLYDAYATIWASDALEYSGGGVAHASAYNYSANKSAAMLAALIGEDAKPFEQEAAKIYKAINDKLWLKNKGWIAEYKDLLGLQNTHDAAGLWTVYHTIDAGVLNALQQYQTMRYVDNYIPHIPLKVNGFEEQDDHLLATTNWQPYTWSVNNVVLSENVHTALAYWQSNEKEKAFHLWKGALVESMYASAAPGNFEQISFYDAIRGELYRDFADPIGIVSKTLVEGLFGIQPDALHNKLLINPGFPSHWNFANIQLPDIKFDFKKEGNTSIYQIQQHFTKPLNLALQIDALKDSIASVRVNGSPIKWSWKKDAINHPAIIIELGSLESAIVKIIWCGSNLEKINTNIISVLNEPTAIAFTQSNVLSFQDPQKAFIDIKEQAHEIMLTPTVLGKHSGFVNLKQGAATWVQPIDFEIKPMVEIVQAKKESGSLYLQLINNGHLALQGSLFINHLFAQSIEIAANESSLILAANKLLFSGTNQVTIKWADTTVLTTQITDWSIQATKKEYQPIHIANRFNAKLSSIFKNKYLSPRASSTSLQIPWQGIGNWCYPLIEPSITDTGLLLKKGVLNCAGIPFQVSTRSNNIVFTSMWDNYPHSASIELSGYSKHAYLLMAGSTNHQQSQFVNGKVVVSYLDGTTDSLLLVNPINCYPIEQDYYTDGYAFTTGASKPYRLVLKTGEFSRTFATYAAIKGFSNYGINGGAATVLDMPLNNSKQLKNFTIITEANEVVIGLLALTLVH